MSDIGTHKIYKINRTDETVKLSLQVVPRVSGMVPDQRHSSTRPMIFLWMKISMFMCQIQEIIKSVKSTVTDMSPVLQVVGFRKFRWIR